MRITPMILCLSLLALVGCSRAGAATVDPNDDFDCATTTAFFREAAKLQPDAPDRARQGLFIFNQWYAAKWTHDHPGGLDASLHDHQVAMIAAMGKDPSSYKEALKTCVNRAVVDPKFDRFSELMQERVPDAR